MVLTRFLLILLAVLNLLVLAASLGWLGSAPPSGEPGRLANQLHPEQLRFVTGNAADPVASAATTSTPAAADAPQPAPTAAPTAAAPPAEAPALPPVAAAQPKACLAWQGLSNEEANGLEARLKSAGADIRRTSVEAPSAWWVRMPPQGSREQAERKVKELKARGVTDYFVVQDPGPNQFAISLGLFKTEAAASQQLAQLRTKGVRTAGIAPRMGAQYRIEATASADLIDTFRGDTGSGMHQTECQP